MATRIAAYHKATRVPVSLFVHWVNNENLAMDGVFLFLFGNMDGNVEITIPYPDASFPTLVALGEVTTASPPFGGLFRALAVNQKCLILRA